jgi:hypothetical protein
MEAGTMFLVSQLPELQAKVTSIPLPVCGIQYVNRKWSKTESMPYI